MKKRISALSLALVLLLTACGGGTAAAAMRLKKTEGTVSVSDGEARAVTLRENLGLYSGYQVETRSESYAWVNLDEVKLTKMDENSDITIQKEDKHLEIIVNSGSLFFNVTEPLADDESLNIRTSTMVVGIRGTCGWVEAPDGEHMNVYLLKGEVECTAGSETAIVAAGEMAKMSVADGRGVITVSALQKEDIPVFVVDELKSGPLDEGDENSSAQKEEWPHITEEILDDGTVYTIEYYEDGSWIEWVTRDDYSSVQERDTLHRIIRHEATSGREYWLDTYQYLENSSEVIVSALWTKEGETVFLEEGFSYTMSDPGNVVQQSGTSVLGGADDYIRTLTISEFRMDTLENIRKTSFVLDMSGAVIEVRDEGLSEGHYG